MEYEIDIEIKYNSLQIRSILAWNEMSKKKQKDTDANPPQGGWGMGSKEPIKKIIFINSGYNIIELIYFLLILIWSEIKSLQSAEIKGFIQMGDPWGNLNAPKATFE